MPSFLNASDLAKLRPLTVLLSTDGEVAQAVAAADARDGARWGKPGDERLLTDEEQAREGQFVALRHGQADNEALMLPTDGLDSYSVDGTLLSVLRVGDDVPRPVAMCTSAEWARHIQATLNAADVAAYPVMVAAAQQIGDLQAEYAHHRGIQDRLDAKTREVVASILGRLGMGPASHYGIGWTGALVAIRERAAADAAALQEARDRMDRVLADLFPDEPAPRVLPLHDQIGMLMQMICNLRDEAAAVAPDGVPG